MKKFKYLMMCCFMVLTLYGCGNSEERQAAIDKFNVEITRISGQEESLNKLIKDSEELLKKDEKALNEELKPKLETSISDSKSKIQELPEYSGNAEEIDKQTKKLKEIDYSKIIESLTESKVTLENSVKQYKLVDYPNERYIISCLQKVNGIVDISAATEDNDPNGNMNKPGGYTAQVYFSSNLIDQNSVIGSTIIEKGTDCGGSIEVYKTVEEAIKRRNYLATYDGSIFANGSHTVIGTVLVRTSNELTATQQKDLEAKIIVELTRLPE